MQNRTWEDIVTLVQADRLSLAYIDTHGINTTSWSSRWQAQTNTSSIVIIIGSQPSFFHGILILNLPTRPVKTIMFRSNQKEHIKVKGA